MYVFVVVCVCLSVCVVLESAFKYVVYVCST